MSNPHAFWQVRLSLFVETNNQIMRFKEHNKYIANRWYHEGDPYFFLVYSLGNVSRECYLLPWYKSAIELCSIYDIHMEYNL